VVLLLAVVATLISDSVWFQLGRHHGLRVLTLLCRLAVNPESCQLRAENFMARHGVRSLLVTKFIPGMNRTVLPLTGITGCSYSKFLAFDTVGAALWATSYTGLGYVFSEELERAVRYAARLGWFSAGLAIAAMVGIYGILRYLEGRRAARKRALDRVADAVDITV
jgi:membrane protein DedA with SNARE-associated domain